MRPMKQTSDISAVLIEWYGRHFRPLPWRETSDPYLIWLSEVILQQTRVAQGLDYFRRFAFSRRAFAGRRDRGRSAEAVAGAGLLQPGP